MNLTTVARTKAIQKYLVKLQSCRLIVIQSESHVLWPALLSGSGLKSFIIYLWASQAQPGYHSGRVTDTHHPPPTLEQWKSNLISSSLKCILSSMQTSNYDTVPPSQQLNRQKKAWVRRLQRLNIETICPLTYKYFFTSKNSSISRFVSNKCTEI